MKRADKRDLFGDIAANIDGIFDSMETTFEGFVGGSGRGDTYVNGKKIDCPGVVHVKNSETNCCVGGTVGPLILSTCDWWPICRGPATTTAGRGPLRCVTMVSVADANYKDIIGSAEASMTASGTKYRTTLGASPGGLDMDARPNMPMQTDGPRDFIVASSASAATRATF